MNSPFTKPPEDKEHIRQMLLKKIEELEKPEEPEDKINNALIHISKMATLSAISSLVNISLIIVVMLWLTFG